ncbi:bifunctional 23S rRNA (guanine(2069)-N(7))-methyltransferase RlmK/23S rRNA (guanine(2445)-N(2))-methyltransferase RlmL [Nitrincola sp. MINF-07-Sa-05]|uniref:bifunctional 23S rRNA (guanine(2069)-N(7))-methyltransferase RlmK/23S rRNA (guanine(2445)-N(2))-methyltransferase RlmL n=1 Tax=Nitrincola salilacus TaxID=3400273 RepID=UPI0039186056
MEINDAKTALNFFVTCPKGIEQLLADELQMLGAESVRQTVAGVSCQGDLALGYGICLWSRLGSRVLMPLAEGEVKDADQLYAVVQQVDWLEHLRPSGTLTVDFNGRCEGINNTHFGALKVKDAIVDQIRDATGQRPSVERQAPDLRVNVHLARDKVVVSLDLSGESLHRRGYRQEAGEAPLKESLAAAILIRTGWMEKSRGQAVLVDPMCGSGTLLIEAALMATDTAPGLLRRQFGFSRWLGHRESLWQALLDEATERQKQGGAKVQVRCHGSDQDSRVLEKAKHNARRAGVDHLISWKVQSVEECMAPELDDAVGLLISNPPYGERLGEVEQLMFLYQQLGRVMKDQFAGWQAGIFTSNPELGMVLGMKAQKRYQLFNGTLKSQLLMFEIYENQPARVDVGVSVESEGQQEAQAAQAKPLSESAQMFANRLRKNFKQLSRWVRKEDIDCYRVYDADMPEYAVAVDYYAGQVVVQEYAPPANIHKVRAFNRLNDVLQAVPDVLGVSAEQVVLKQRKRQQGTDQYQKQDETDHFFTVTEHGCQLLVNLHDYLDTGLFLDHRPIRRHIQSIAAGKDVLNLFCYTASATVHAIVGGAQSSVSVDMSSTYLAWAKRNFRLNNADQNQHKLVQTDCMRWLEEQQKPAYDLIFMDPPTFSNSKRMEGVLDVQRDHVVLVEGAMRLLRPDGVLIFSNNYRRFKLDHEALSAYEVADITHKTLDPDFKRSTKIHCCFEIRHKR